MVADCKRGRTNTGDAERSYRPKELVIHENIEKVWKVVLARRKVKLQEIDNILKLLKELVDFILH